MAPTRHHPGIVQSQVRSLSVAFCRASAPHAAACTRSRAEHRAWVLGGRMVGPNRRRTSAAAARLSFPWVPPEAADEEDDAFILRCEQPVPHVWTAGSLPAGLGTSHSPSCRVAPEPRRGPDECSDPRSPRLSSIH
jgi:hypothetical protein